MVDTASSTSFLIGVAFKKSPRTFINLELNMASTTVCENCKFWNETGGTDEGLVGNVAATRLPRKLWMVRRTTKSDLPPGPQPARISGAVIMRSVRWRPKNCSSAWQPSKSWKPPERLKKAHSGMGLADILGIWLNLKIAPILKIAKIPSTKVQIPNKYQHAAQAPALRVIEIKNPKQKKSPRSFDWLRICFGHWSLGF